MDALLHMHFFCHEDKIIHKYDTNLESSDIYKGHEFFVENLNSDFYL
jgi:hypothetical protein